MKALTFLSTRQSAAIAVLALTLASGAALAADTKLTGAQEVPPVKTSASGNEAIKVSPDGSVSGSVTTKGVDATMAHIHHGAAGSNGVEATCTITQAPTGAAAPATAASATFAGISAGN